MGRCWDEKCRLFLGRVKKEVGDFAEGLTTILGMKSYNTYPSGYQSFRNFSMVPPHDDDARIQVLDAKFRGLLNRYVFHARPLSMLIGCSRLGNIICESMVAVFLSHCKSFDSGQQDLAHLRESLAKVIISS